MKNIKQYFFILSFFFISFKTVTAQNNYISHTLKQGETLSALAIEYNTNVGDIMRLNGMHAGTKLVYGLQIKIPATEVKTVSRPKVLPVVEQNIQAPENSTIHTVIQGETLYSISKQYKVSMDQLKAWNNLPDDNISLGTAIIVGRKTAAADASIIQQKQRVGNQQQIENIEQQVKVDSSPSDENKPTEIDIMPNDTNTGIITEPNAAVNKNSEPGPALNRNGEGFFADQFTNKKNKNLQHIAGTAMTFKTTSGWSDGKYYILMNSVNPGTIVKISADNGNVIYAKVLWDMGDMKENAGLDFRISNAAAAALDLNDTRFNLNVSY